MRRHRQGIFDVAVPGVAGAFIMILIVGFFIFCIGFYVKYCEETKRTTVWSSIFPWSSLSPSYNEDEDDGDHEYGGYEEGGYENYSCEEAAPWSSLEL